MVTRHGREMICRFYFLFFGGYWMVKCRETEQISHPLLLLPL